jgi:dolichol-phosphate mannosyltransferase
MAGPTLGSGPASAPPGFPGPELTVIVPTRNECLNVAPLFAKLGEVLAGLDWEAIFVDDDSTDGTVDALRDLARLDRRARLLHRIGRRGLSSACIEGIQASAAPFVAVIDADLQHDEALLPLMLAVLQTEPVDLVVGSRYVEGGGVEGWDRKRASMSDLATRLGRLVLRVRIADPMSGFFMIRRDAFDGAVRGMSALGFKILIDLLASSPVPLRVRELPYQFRQRVAGESKLDSQVAWEYLMLLADKLVGHIVPIRFMLFSLVGLTGLGAHLVVLWLAYHVLALPFPASQAIATVTAMVGNFTLNNFFTYSDRRLTGWDFARGLLSFCLICSVGAVANVGIASFLLGQEHASWWFAGFAGAAMSSVWNYAVRSVITWKRR